MTPDYFTPSTACLIQERLGLNDQEVMCFDLNAACSGFLYALTVAPSPNKTQVLRSLKSIILEISSLPMTKAYFSSMFCNNAWATVKAYTKPLQAAFKSNQDHYLTMAGQEVFKFAIKVIPESINAILEKTNLTPFH